MTYKLLGCPICGSEVCIDNTIWNWKDDRRYVEMEYGCCFTMTARIGWNVAKDMTDEAIEEALRKKLAEKWNTRDTVEQKNSDRYRKLRGWMTSNVPEGWEEVCRVGAVGAWMSWEDMDDYIDNLPECNVGLMEKRT